MNPVTVAFLGTLMLGSRGNHLSLHFTWPIGWSALVVFFMISCQTQSSIAIYSSLGNCLGEAWQIRDMFVRHWFPFLHCSRNSSNEPNKAWTQLQTCSLDTWSLQEKVGVLRKHLVSRTDFSFLIYHSVSMFHGHPGKLRRYGSSFR